MFGTIRPSFLPPAHAHYLQAVTSRELGHSHIVQLFTYPVNGSARDGHVHDFQGHTFLDRDHFHRFYGKTGPALPLPDGSHYHDIRIEVDDEPFQFQGGSYKTVLTIPRHVHTFGGATGKPLGSDSPF
ncbi:YmaF family protein [Paenibacillus flagellatus]|uniref:YmaF family protein n=1 Tax=Paenibacillus flagellatus TaxID=2211139 RepID=A0A2V5KJX9_9BACL|nr:YmaF family protein [Paenibacillus flagellatus]PYI55000.1 hypothetical protein DLM86_10690 [Paenibacillus flagellatus]